MKTRIYFFVFFFGMLSSFAAKATHIVGGEMNYTCLGDDRYEITLTIFRDCFYGDPNAWFDNPASIGVFDVNNQLLGQILIPLMENDTLSPVLSGDCFVVPPDVCVHTTTYRAEVLLPMLAGGYQLAYQRCCRNQTIQNIVDPLASGATYGVTISERALRECNSNPKFKSWPPIYICVNEPIQFDQSATDVDGDSIVYKLCTPLLGASQAIPRPQPPTNPPYDPVVWVAPTYGLDNMLNGIPGGAPLRIDPLTGILTGTPTTIGQFVVGICVEEYREGEIISTTRRDFQYNVGLCGRPTAAFFAPEVQCGDLEVTFANQSVESNNFLWQFANDDNTSNNPNPTFTFPDTGTYEVRLIIEPNTICADTFERAIQLLPATLQPDFDINFTACTDTLEVQVSDLSTDSASEIITWNWSLQPTAAFSTEQNPTFYIDTSGQYEVQLRLQAANGCQATFLKPFDAQLVEENLPDSLVVCLGDAIDLHPNFNPDYRYLWSPSNDLDDPTLPNPQAMPMSNTIYTAQISDADGFCQIERSIAVRVAAPIDTLRAIAEPDTIFGRGEAQLTATFDSNFVYHWFPENSLTANNIFNPLANPTETTVYQLFVQNEDGCTKETMVTVNVVNLLCEVPFVFIPNTFTPNGDGVNDVFRVRGNNFDEVYLTVFNRWGQRVFETRSLDQGWDGTFNGEPALPDVYGFYAFVQCFDGSTFQQEGNLTLIR